MAEQAAEHVEGQEEGAAQYANGGEYINHHLGLLTFGKHPEGYEHAGEWGFAHSEAEAKAMGFWALNVDTMGMSLVTGLIFLAVFMSVSRKVTSGVPEP